MYQEILYEVQDPVATITLNRPERLNAISMSMEAEVQRALADAERRPDVVGIVITGAGRGFCSGADMQNLRRSQDTGLPGGGRVAEPEPEGLGDPEMGEDFAIGFGYMLRVRKPIIAAINGAAAGKGFSLAMWCDIRIAAEDAVMVTSFAQRGLVVEHGMAWLLPRLIGTERALDILWNSPRLSGREAQGLGLVSRVVPRDQVLDEAKAYVRRLAEGSSPSSVMHMKRQVYRSLLQGLSESIEEGHTIYTSRLGHPDFKEGVSAFMERRPPRFDRVSIG